MSLFEKRSALRIVLSRKGFDSGSGGCPSPIIDGRVTTLPIPASPRQSRTTYEDLGLGQLVDDLTKHKAHHTCHHDPNLTTGCFGQVGAAQSHLDAAGVGHGDLFLFFGLFREAEKVKGRWKFTGRPHHRIFGWLRIADVMDSAAIAAELPRDISERLHHHPHTLGGWSANNCIYVGARRLGLADIEQPGFGYFLQADDRHWLTDPEQSLPSVWNLPEWLNPRHGGPGMSYHGNKDRWSDAGVRTVGRGQEFIIEVPDVRLVSALQWVRHLFGLGS